MNKNLKIGLAALVGILLIGGGYWYYQSFSEKKGTQSLENLRKDPFAGVSVPATVDAATAAVMTEKIALTKEMFASKPEIWETWVAIGNLKTMLGDYQGALAAYQVSVTLQSNNIVAERNIAALYANQLADYEKAALHYRLAIANEVNNAELYANLVNIEWKKFKDFKAAEATLIDGLNRTKNNYDLVYLAVDFYTATSQADKAAEYSKLLNTIKPATKPEPAVLGIPVVR